MSFSANLNQGWSWILCALDEKPECQPNFRNKTKRPADIGDRNEAREEERLKESRSPGNTMHHQHDAQNFGEETGSENQVAKREEPGTKK